MHRLAQKTDLRTNPDLKLTRPQEYYNAKIDWNIFKEWLKKIEPKDLDNLNLVGKGKCTQCDKMMNVGHLEYFHNWNIYDFKCIDGRSKLNE